MNTSEKNLSMGKVKKEKLLRLKIKKASFFLLGLSFFFLPGENYYLNLRTVWQPARVQTVNIDLPLPVTYPINYVGQPVPFLTAHSALVIDRDSAVVMYEKNPRSQLRPASTVKIMTALVSINHYQPDEILTVNSIDWEGQDVGLEEGEKISARALLYSLLVASANDAAQVLANNYSGDEGTFVAAMNAKAKELSLADSYFASPSGLDTDGGYSLTTTLDLARLTTYALRNPFFAQIVATPQITVTDMTGKIVHQLYNINQLLGQIEGLKGVKTGWTEEAGECLVSYVERGSKGIVVVVLGSQDRFSETAELINWAFANFEWESPIQATGDQ